MTGSGACDIGSDSSNRSRRSGSASPRRAAVYAAGMRSSAVRLRLRSSAALWLAMASVGCGYRHTPPVIVSGRNFPCRSAIGIEGEPTPAEVIALIGGPLERQTVAAGEVLHYSVRGRYGDRVKLFGLLTISEPHHSWSCDVRLEFRGGHLYSITHTRDDDGPDGTEKEGPTTRIVRAAMPAR